MLQTITAHGEHFGGPRVQQAQQQQAQLADLQGGLLSGNCFQRFLAQRCGASSQANQICGHPAFAQAVSGMIRCLSPLHSLDCRNELSKLACMRTACEDYFVTVWYLVGLVSACGACECHKEQSRCPAACVTPTV